MTVREIIVNSLPIIEGSKVSKEVEFTTLLSYFNYAKSRLARDTNLWIGGTVITMTDANEYTLPVIPLQIYEVYDENLQIRPRNSIKPEAYRQISPKRIYVNNPNPGLKLYLNYFEEPNNYVLDDEVEIPNDLIEAMQHYMAYKVFSVYKSENEEIKTKIHLDQYKMIISEYIFKTDEPDIDSLEELDRLTQKGLV